jgi:hypothetical protein
VKSGRAVCILPAKTCLLLEARFDLAQPLNLLIGYSDADKFFADSQIIPVLWVSIDGIV